LTSHYIYVIITSLINIKHYKPFSEMKKELLSDPEVKKYYDELKPEYDLIRSIIDKRTEKKISQLELAKRVGTGQSAISRLEGGNYNPSFRFLQKVAKALGARLTVSLH
jgi:ribosome-binding protein aMBF1 (putative translation factor)